MNKALNIIGKVQSILSFANKITKIGRVIEIVGRNFENMQKEINELNNNKDVTERNVKDD